jgi:branched-chain amino acid transport system permease protein
MLQALLTGLATGAIYGLIAMGYAVVYFVTKVINFATGQLMMCAIMAVAVLTMHGVNVWLALIIAVAISTIGAVIIYFLAVRAVLRFDRLSFAWLVSTLGVGIILESLAAIIWGTSSLPTPVMLNGKDVSLLGGQLTWQQIITIIVAIVAAIAVELFRRRTLFGKLGMAISSDPDTASATGANVLAYAVLAFALGGLLVGIAGILEAPISFANPYLGDTFGISGFVALMIGGIERPAASMGGGLLLGVLSIFASTYINPEASDWFPFVVVMVILLIVPNGLFVSGGNFRSMGRRLTSRRAT